MQNVKKNTLHLTNYDMNFYHQESFDIESSTAQKNMAINLDLPEHKVTESEINEYNVTLSKSGEILPCGEQYEVS